MCPARAKLNVRRLCILVAVREGSKEIVCLRLTLT